MGSTGSRPSLSKVAPCNSLQEEGEQHKKQWTLPALPVTLEQSSGSRGCRKTTLPPLKQDITLSTLTGSLALKQSNNSSIIHAYPPRRPQALEPLALQIGHTSTANQIAMDRNYRNGGVHRFSTAGQTGHTGTSRMVQGAFLEAQTALSQQVHRQRHAHLRQGRELRRHKVIYTDSQNTKGIQRLKLVRRPTERDIFFDETTGESLDPRCLLESTTLPNRQLLPKATNKVQHDRRECPKNRQALKAVQQTGHRGWILNKNLS